MTVLDTSAVVDFLVGSGAAEEVFVALAERLGGPLATRDLALAQAARERTGIEAMELAA